jgi:hypothetical protein
LMAKNFSRDKILFIAMVCRFARQQLSWGLHQNLQRLY